MNPLLFELLYAATDFEWALTEDAAPSGI